MQTHKSTLRQRRAEELRAEILSTTIKILARDGLRESTTAEVARRAGVSEGAVFWHFGSKAGLLKEVTFELLRRMDVGKGIDFDDPETTAREKLLAIVDRIVYLARTQAEAFRAATVLFTDNTLMKEIRSEFTELLIERRRRTAALIKLAAERGEVDSVSATVFGEMMSGAVQGMHVHLRHHRKGYDPEPMFVALRRMALALLGLDEDGELLHPKEGVAAR